MSEIPKDSAKLFKKVIDDLLNVIEDNLQLYQLTGQPITPAVVQMAFRGYYAKTLLIADQRVCYWSGHFTIMLSRFFATALAHSETVECSNIANMCNVIREGIQESLKQSRIDLRDHSNKSDTINTLENIKTKMLQTLEIEAHPHQWN